MPDPNDLTPASPTRRALLTFGATAMLTPARPPLLAQPAEALRVGVVDALTGPRAAAGRDRVHAIRMAAAEINAQGGVAGHRLDLYVVEEAEAERLVTETPVPALIAARGEALRRFAERIGRDGTLLLALDAPVPEVIMPDTFAIGTAPAVAPAMRALGTYLYGTMNCRRASVLFINETAGVDSAAAFRQGFVDAGGRIVDYEAFEPGSPDVAAIGKTLRASRPDVVHVHADPGAFAAIAGVVRGSLPDALVTGDRVAFDPALVAMLGPNAAHLLVATTASDAGDRLTAWHARWRREKGHAPHAGSDASLAHDAIALVAGLAGRCLSRRLPVVGACLRAALLDDGPFVLPLNGTVEPGRTASLSVSTSFWQLRDGRFERVAHLD